MFVTRGARLDSSRFFTERISDALNASGSEPQSRDGYSTVGSF